MNYKKITFKGNKLVRINAKKADDILNHPKKYDGVTLYTLPVNANPESPWIDGFFEITMDIESMDATDCNRWISEVKYYNCNSELGSYLKYYITEEDALLCL